MHGTTIKITVMCSHAMIKFCTIMSDGEIMFKEIKYTHGN